MINKVPNYVMLESDGTMLYQINQVGNKTPIGYTNEAYEQLMGIAEQYKKKLEDAGLIQKELTPEEIQAKQNQLMEKLFNKLDSFESRLSGLETSLGGTEDD